MRGREEGFVANCFINVSVALIAIDIIRMK